MGTGAATLGLVEVMSALETALTALKAAGADPAYRVGGTGAALLQGVRLPVGDLDLLVAQRKDVDAFAAALSSFPCLCTPSWLPESAQYFTRYEVNGAMTGCALPPERRRLAHDRLDGRPALDSADLGAKRQPGDHSG